MTGNCHHAPSATDSACGSPPGLDRERRHAHGKTSTEDSVEDPLDTQVVALLKAVAPTPSEWAAIDDALARYGYTILRSWIAHGTVFARVRKLTGIRLPALPGPLAEPDAPCELASMTVAVALTCFRRTLRKKAWDPQRGAGVRTFFVGQCLLSFPNEYRRWLREHPIEEQPTDLWTEPARMWEDNRSSDPANIVTTRSEVRDALCDVDQRTQTALWAFATGYSHREIAALLGTTPKSVEMLLYRCRRRHAQRSPAPPSRCRSPHDPALSG